MPICSILLLHHIFQGIFTLYFGLVSYMVLFMIFSHGSSPCYNNDVLSVYVCFFTDQKPVVPLLINPSITPWRYPGPSTDSWPHNPALRVLFYTTGENPYLSNYTQYYLDLKDVNKKTEPASFRTEYTFTAAYDVNDVTATSLHAVVAKYKTSQSDSPFYGSFTRNLVSFDTSGRRRCMNCSCTGFHICVLENVYYDRLDACAADVRAACGEQGLPVPGVALLLLVAIIGIHMLRSTCSYM